MDSMNPPSSSEIANDLSPLIQIYKDGKIQRLVGNDIVPPSLDPKTNVASKDIVYFPENNLSARLYLPKNAHQKLPLLVYIHGGGFCIESAFSPLYNSYLNALVSEANIIAVSVDYRRAPEHPLPIAYDDSWAAIKWVASHANRSGPDDWLNRYADFQRVFISGDSAGANIAHHMGMRLGQEILDGVNVTGIVLIHPFFWGTEPVGKETSDVKERAFNDRIWRLACPSSSGSDDPWINPAVGPGLGCARVLVFVAEKDLLCARGWFYHDKLKESRWRGHVEIVESKGEGHVFHLFNPTLDNSLLMLKKTAAFFNQNNA